MQQIGKRLDRMLLTICLIAVQEFRRRYNLVPLVKQDLQDDITNARTRATVRCQMSSRVCCHLLSSLHHAENQTLMRTGG